MKSNWLEIRWSHLLPFLMGACIVAASGAQAHPASFGRSGPEPTKAQVQLIFAIWDHNLKAGATLLDDGLDPNFLFRRDPRDAQITPLTESIAEHEPQMIQLLFQHGAKADFGEEQGATALGVAAWYGGVGTLKELLKRGAHVDARDSEGYTPLLQAASKSKDLTIIQLLIDAGADVKAKSSKTGQTAIMSAAFNLNLEAVRLFLDRGVDACAYDSNGETAVDSANIQILEPTEKNKLAARKAIVELLESRCPPE